MGKRTVRDVDVGGKRVLLRADLNVPLDEGRITDDTRIRASLPTVRFLLDAGAAVILCSHLGRPNGVTPGLSLAPVAGRLQELLALPVAFAADCTGPAARDAAAALRPGDLLLLENLRFHAEEEANDPGFAAELASLADLYVNDAFGAAHRAHASTAGVAAHLPAVAGLLMEKEVRYLAALVASPPRPFALLVGGAKVSTKIPALNHLLPKLDLLLVGGGMANTLLKASGVGVGASLVEEEQMSAAADILRRAAGGGPRVVLPRDVIAARAFDATAERRTMPVGEVPPEWLVLDIGPETVAAYGQALGEAAAVIWNGPMGVFEMEPFAAGSLGMARVLADLQAVTVVGGGETAAVVALAGLGAEFTHVSTGGGASLEMLEGRELPGVAALDDAG
ncbi:MAG: phosphoglycerate kinase [Dehalococcoidia bacterium]